jgi:hypothetical protein
MNNLTASQKDTLKTPGLAKLTIIIALSSPTTYI